MHGNTKPPFCIKNDLIYDYVKLKLSYKSIALKYVTSIRRVKKWIHEYKITPRPKHSLKDLTGQRFGRLIVIKFIPKKQRKKKDSSAYWECKCDCGKIVVIKTSSLLRNLTKSCGCFKKDLVYKGYKQLSGVYLHRIKKGALKRGLVHSVSKEYLWNLFVKQNNKCALSGLPIELVSDYTYKHHLNTASLDRINTEKGYIKGNIRWVHRDINMMRRNLENSYFIDLCRKVANEHK